MKLHIGNKNYSSWSMRPWIAMRHGEIAFEEILTPFDDHGGNPAFREFSPTGKVPALVDGDLTIWESLAILEYVAEKHPDAGLWPEDRVERARARAAACEMHAGFTALRSACPMNIRRQIAPLSVDDAVRRDVSRIETLFAECLDRSGGPFLFGGFTNADAMYAPVVNRLEVYALSESPAVRAYTAAIKALPAWREWEDAARAETWTVLHEEV